MGKKKSSRPIIVTLYAALQMFAGLMVMLAGLFILLIGGSIATQLVIDYPELAGLGAVVALIWASIFILGLIIFLIGYGLWKLNFLAWLITVILLGLTTLSNILGYEILLSYIETGNYNYLFTPIIQFLLLVYFIKISGRFR